MSDEDQLDREKIKEKKRKMKMNSPKFQVQNHGFIKAITKNDRWRKPRGVSNKKRMKREWTGAIPSIGYKKPDEIRGLHPNGTKEVLVHNTQDLQDLDPEKHSVMIASKVGKRKRQKIKEVAEEKNLTVLNE